jgi:hypothetical protein
VGAPPPPNVLAAFGVRDDTSLTPLAGALEQSAWRAGDVVLKPVQASNPGEGEWVATVLDVIVEDGFRVIKPVRTVDGRWLEAGWTAWRWIDGEHERAKWRDVTVAADALHAAIPDAIARAAVDVRPAWLDTRRHRWALAEATVWHGAPLPPIVNAGEVERDLYNRAIALGPPLTADERAASQVVHGDIASNVLQLADGSGHAFIDMSPGWRPASSIGAQIAVEAVTWFHAPPETLDGFAPADLARACAFRLLCGLQVSADWATDFPGELKRFTRTMQLIGA